MMWLMVTLVSLTGEYPEFGYDCEGSCLEDSDADGTCDAFDLCPFDAEDSCVGCTDETATNAIQ